MKALDDGRLVYTLGSPGDDRSLQFWLTPVSGAFAAHRDGAAKPVNAVRPIEWILSVPGGAGCVDLVRETFPFIQYSFQYEAKNPWRWSEIPAPPEAIHDLLLFPRGDLAAALVGPWSHDHELITTGATLEQIAQMQLGTYRRFGMRRREGVQDGVLVPSYTGGGDLFPYHDDCGLVCHLPNLAMISQHPARDAGNSPPLRRQRRRTPQHPQHI